MPRPSLTHDGFLIPNAADVSNPRMAEPDRIDFNTVAHARWGVIEGCLVTVSGATAQCALGGIAIVDNKLVTVSSGQSVNVGVGGALDRFDLIAVNAGGNLVHIGGTPAEDPVFPDPPTNVTVLAAVYAPTGTATLSDNVIDKRKFVAKSLLTKVETYDPLVQNRNGTGNEFLLQGDGKMTWKGDTILERASAGYLRVTQNLIVNQSLQTDQVLATGLIQTINGLINGRNLRQDAVTPPTEMGPYDHFGDIWQDMVNGKLFLRKKDGSTSKWEEVVTTSGGVPVGAIMQSVEPPSVMGPQGWVPMQGQTVTESQFPRLFTLVGLAGRHTGNAPNRSMLLPNAEGKILMTNFNVAIGTTGGNTDNKVKLAIANMPKHKHNVATDAVGSSTLAGHATTSRAGSHTHSMSKGGKHIHLVSEKAHVHQGMDYAGVASPVVCLVYGGQNKLDALFNDRNHTYSVEAAKWTMPATAQVDVLENYSEHAHILEEDGDHTHTISGSVGGHNHHVDEDYQGSNTPFDITPEYLTLFTYIRS